MALMPRSGLNTASMVSPTNGSPKQWIKAILLWLCALALAGGVGMVGLLMMAFASDGVTRTEIA